MVDVGELERRNDVGGLIKALQDSDGDMREGAPVRLVRSAMRGRLNR